jgi:hypothetical protein
VRTLVRSARLWTVTMIGSELNLDHQQTVHDILTEELDMGTLGFCITTTLPVTLPRPWTKFWPKRVFQWFRSPIFAWFRVRVTSSFSRNSNFTSEVVILELWTTWKGSWQNSWGHFHTNTSSTATVSGNVSISLWLPKETNLKRVMLIFSSVFNKNVIAPVTLLFRHTLYFLGRHKNPT